MSAQSQGANKRRTDVPATPGNPPTNKRSRVSRACDQCRTAREKCDGHPICSTCAGSRRQCTYTTNPKKRGIQPGYIRTLELALTYLFNNSDAETILNKKLAQEGTSSVLLQRDTKESNKLHKSWRKSKFCRDIDKLLSGEVVVEEDIRSPNTDDPGSENEGVFPQGTLAPSLEDSTPIPQPAAQVAPTVPPPRVLQQNKLITLPPNQWRLFDIYFAYTHYWFPICEKHDILKLSYTYSEAGLSLSPDMPASGDQAELWSILALASLQSTSEDVATSTMTNHHSSDPMVIYDIARSLIPLESGNFGVGHVKALLLLSLFNLGLSRPQAAWLLIGQASRLIIEMEQRNSPLISRLRHVMSGCFLLDSFVSMRLGRRPYLRPFDVERVGKVNEDGLEEWQPWTGCERTGSQCRAPALSLSTYNRLVELVGIISSTEAPDFTNTSPQDPITSLETWKVSLPPTFNYVISSPASTASNPSAVLLQAAYYCCNLVVRQSQTSVQRVLEVLETFPNKFGSLALPPILDCLLDIVWRHTGASMRDDALDRRFLNLRMGLQRAWNHKRNHADTIYHSPAAPRSSFQPSYGSHAQTPRTESMQIPFDPSLAPIILDLHAPPIQTLQRQPLDLGHVSPQPVRAEPRCNHALDPSIINRAYGSSSRNLERFFDDMASLDGTGRVERQPQFLQNLGFPPDASMSDLLTSEFGKDNPYIQQGYTSIASS